MDVVVATAVKPHHHWACSAGLLHRCSDIQEQTVFALFAFIVLRGFTRLLQEDNIFVLLAGAGLLGQFGLQALVNMGSTLRLIPTKGMTLPFISYGGSNPCCP